MKTTITTWLEYSNIKSKELEWNKIFENKTEKPTTRTEEKNIFFVMPRRNKNSKNINRMMSMENKNIV